MHSDRTPVLIVHGGAGDLVADDPTSSGGPEAPRLEGVRRACAAGWSILRSGGSALDAVEAAVRALEDDPLFNAGTGSTLTAAGDVELDASIMDGASLRCGAVAVVKDVRNPISLARAVMERSHHVLLAGPGASAFAREQGVPPYENRLLVTPHQRARWEAARGALRAQGQPDEAGRERAEEEAGSARRRAEAEPTQDGIPGGLHPPGTKTASKTGTVGAVARDALGHLAAATSTGGMSMKLPGRVGDTPLIGCGTYADDALGAVSCTGHGERIIQLTLARHAADLVGRGASPMDAARDAAALLTRRVQGSGGLIVVGPRGEPGFAHNTPAMSRAWTAPDGTIRAEL
jgi:L-asparaginase / beta-aspartyl-peptidase